MFFFFFMRGHQPQDKNTITFDWGKLASLQTMYSSVHVFSLFLRLKLHAVPLFLFNIKCICIYCIVYLLSSAFLWPQESCWFFPHSKVMVIYCNQNCTTCLVYYISYFQQQELKRQLALFADAFAMEKRDRESLQEDVRRGDGKTQALELEVIHWLYEYVYPVSSSSFFLFYFSLILRSQY